MSLTVITAEQAAAQAPAKTATPAPAPTEATTTEAKEPRTLEALKAARREAAATETPVAGEPTKTDPPKPGKTTKTVDVKLPDEKLSEFKKLNSELMEARKKLAALEPVAAKSANVEKALKMIAEGKQFDGIRELVGIDAFNAAVKQVIGAEAAAPAETPKEKELREKLEALEKDGATTKEQLATAAAAQREYGVTKIIEEVKAAAEQFPYLSRSPEWVREALKGADEAYPKALAKKREDSGDAKADLDDGEKNALIRAALEVAEEDHKGRAKLYATPEAAPAPKAKPQPRTVDNSMRAAVTKVAPHKKSMTLEELKKERRARS